MTWFLISWLYLFGTIGMVITVTAHQGNWLGWLMVLGIAAWPLTLPAALIITAVGGDQPDRQKAKQE